MYMYMYIHVYVQMYANSSLQSSDNPEDTVGGHAPLKAESSSRQSYSPPQSVRKRNSTAPLLEHTETSEQGAEPGGESVGGSASVPLPSACLAYAFFYFYVFITLPNLSSSDIHVHVHVHVHACMHMYTYNVHLYMYMLCAKCQFVDFDVQTVDRRFAQ